MPSAPTAGLTGPGSGVKQAVMALFESMLALMVVAILLLQVSRRLAIPYPTMLATAGVAIAALPWAPRILIDPQLALALFIAPALLDAAFDLPPRALRRNWASLLALAAGAVLVTTAAVAWVGVALAGLPLFAAIALGAIVAPPDAAAATAMLARLPLPRRTLTVLRGESLLNDAVALLVFSWAVGAAAAESTLDMLPALAFAVPGGLLFGFAVGRIYVWLARSLAGTLGGRLFEFVATFGVWVIAEHLQLSAILAVVAYAMTIAQLLPALTAARDRVHSYSVWEAMVFLLNVLAFLLMGLQAREIVTRLQRAELADALLFAVVVMAVVIGVRCVWVLLYNRLVNFTRRRQRRDDAPSLARGVVISWCGMRGLVTLATALALPANFPQRDLIVLSALAVVLGTLVLQGLTIGPLIRLLKFQRDGSFDAEVSRTRVALLDAAIAALDGTAGDPSTGDAEAAALLRAEYQDELSVAREGRNPRHVASIHKLRRAGVAARRRRLAALRSEDQIEDDVFHALEQELDWAELAASPTEGVEVIEG
jgi:Na+/H+ antiporter